MYSRSRSSKLFFCVFFISCLFFFFIFFFFSSRRRHTRSYGDWSSDVCSSDLTDPAATQNVIFCRASLACSGALVLAHGRAEGFQGPAGLGGERPGMDLQALGLLEDDRQEIGRASCRERVETGAAGEEGINSKE